MPVPGVVTTSVKAVYVSDLPNRYREPEMGKKKMSRKALEMTDEGLDFGLPFADDYQGTLRAFIESERLTPGQTYFMGRASERGPFMVVASCSV